MRCRLKDFHESLEKRGYNANTDMYLQSKYQNMQGVSTFLSICVETCAQNKFLITSIHLDQAINEGTSFLKNLKESNFINYSRA